MSDLTATSDPNTLPQEDIAPGYSRVDHDTAFAIIKLRKARPEITQEDIAHAVGKHPSTVSRWLQLLDTDSVPEARKLAKSQSLRATMKLADQIEHSDPRVSQGAAKAVVALAGVQEQTQQTNVAVQVIVGNSTAPAGPDPFETITVVKSES